MDAGHRVTFVEVKQNPKSYFAFKLLILSDVKGHNTFSKKKNFLKVMCVLFEFKKNKDFEKCIKI